jgi:hypothetical protein
MGRSILVEIVINISLRISEVDQHGFRSLGEGGGHESTTVGQVDQDQQHVLQICTWERGY